MEKKQANAIIVKLEDDPVIKSNPADSLEPFVSVSTPANPPSLSIFASYPTIAAPPTPPNTPDIANVVPTIVENTTPVVENAAAPIVLDKKTKAKMYNIEYNRKKAIKAAEQSAACDELRQQIEELKKNAALPFAYAVIGNTDPSLFKQFVTIDEAIQYAVNTFIYSIEKNGTFVPLSK